MGISQGKNEKKKKNLTDLSGCKYKLKYVRLDSGIHSRRPPKYPCHMKLVTGPSSVVLQSLAQTLIILCYSHAPGVVSHKEGHNTQWAEIFLHPWVPFPPLQCTYPLFFNTNINLIYKNIFIVRVSLCSWKLFSLRVKAFWNSKISMTVAELYNLTAQRNVKRTAFQFQAQPNIYPRVSTFLIWTRHSNSSLSHTSAGHKNEQNLSTA